MGSIYALIYKKPEKLDLTMKSLLILGPTESLFQEIEATKPTPGYYATTAIDWTNWGVTETNNLSWGNAANGGNDATTAYSVINLHDLNWTTDSTPVENDKPTSFDSLVATTGASLEEILATTELMMPQFTTESPIKDEATTSLIGLLGKWTTEEPKATTDSIELDMVTTQEVVVTEEAKQASSDATTVPALPVSTTVAFIDMIANTTVEAIDEIIATTSANDNITSDVTIVETRKIEHELANKNGSLLWAQLHPVKGRVDEGELVRVVQDYSDDAEAEVEVIEVEEIIEIEIGVEVQSNATEVNTNQINPRIIATASTSGLRPTLFLILASVLTFILDN